MPLAASSVALTALTALLYHTVTVGGDSSCSGYTLEMTLSSSGSRLKGLSIVSPIVLGSTVGLMPGPMLADGMAEAHISEPHVHS